MPISKASGQAVAPAAKGDLVVGSATNDAAVLAVGSANQVLTVDSSTTTGLKWATPSAGGMTLLATTTIDNTVSTYTYSSLGSYKHIYIIGQGLIAATAGLVDAIFRFNSDTGGNYAWANDGIVNTSTGSQWGYNDTSINIGVVFARTGNSTMAYGNFSLFVPDYRGSSYKSTQFFSYAQPGNGGSFSQRAGNGHWNNTSAITSITILTSSAVNMTAGTIKVYGVD